MKFQILFLFCLTGKIFWFSGPMKMNYCHWFIWKAIKIATIWLVGAPPSQHQIESLFHYLSFNNNIEHRFTNVKSSSRTKWFHSKWWSNDVIDEKKFVTATKNSWRWWFVRLFPMNDYRNSVSFNTRSTYYNRCNTTIKGDCYFLGRVITTSSPEFSFNDRFTNRLEFKGAKC